MLIDIEPNEMICIGSNIEKNLQRIINFKECLRVFLFYMSF